MSMIKEPAETDRMKPASTGSDNDGPPPAASLSAAMVRRGNNPWWGKDQPKPAPVAKAKSAAPAGADAPAWHPPRPLRARALLAREERQENKENAEAIPDGAIAAAGPRAAPRGGFAAAPQDDAGSFLENMPPGLLRDIGIFLAVFSLSFAVILYLSFGAG